MTSPYTRSITICSGKTAWRGLGWKSWPWRSVGWMSWPWRRFLRQSCCLWWRTAWRSLGWKSAWCSPRDRGPAAHPRTVGKPRMWRRLCKLAWANLVTWWLFWQDFQIQILEWKCKQILKKSKKSNIIGTAKIILIGIKRLLESSKNILEILEN